jgi:hypothetical protein
MKPGLDFFSHRRGEWEKYETARGSGLPRIVPSGARNRPFVGFSRRLVTSVSKLERIDPVLSVGVLNDGGKGESIDPTGQVVLSHPMLIIVLTHSGGKYVRHNRTFRSERSMSVGRLVISVEASELGER